MRWVPWAAKEDDPKIDGERFKVTKMTNHEAEREKVEAEQKAPVRLMIKREDLEKHGFTTRCPGCKAILRGTARQGHSEQCRARLTEAMKGEFVERRLEAQDAKRRKMAEENHPEATVESAVRPRWRGIVKQRCSSPTSSQGR